MNSNFFINLGENTNSKHKHYEHGFHYLNSLKFVIYYNGREYFKLN